ncbi:MAG: glycosyltransferase family 2 protein [Nannocystaceae bacterium]
MTGASQAGDSPTIAVVVPVYNGARFLGRSIPALRRSDPDVSVVVVDAGSTDGSGDLAEALGVKVIRLAQREGPARARNVGVEHTTAEIVLFVDADCVAHRDVVARVRAAFATDPELVSLTGSYDADPPDPGFFSQYMNLRHRYHHQRARTQGASFWTGCGAVRRNAFLGVGGFDATRYPRPQIEDIELGVRMSRAGRCCLDPGLEVTHLKVWTLASVVSTDIFQRALPWSRLIFETRSMHNDLNTAFRHRLAALLSPGVLVAPVLIAAAGSEGAPVVVVGGGVLWLLVATALAADMFGFLRRLRGTRFALWASLFHQIHLSYSAAAFSWCAFDRLRTLVFGARSEPGHWRGSA